MSKAKPSAAQADAPTEQASLPESPAEAATPAEAQAQPQDNTEPEVPASDASPAAPMVPVRVIVDS